MHMRTARILLGLGVWLAILPYLGFPYSWKMALVTLTGLGLIYISYAMYQDNKKDGADETFDNFKENGSLFFRHAVRSAKPETETPPETDTQPDAGTRAEIKNG